MLPATDKNKARVETLLKKLVDVFAGDPAVCEVARLMRLPGSHNTKDGEWLPVEIVNSGGNTYTIEDLEAWLDNAKSLLTSKSAARKAKADNPFTDYASRTPTQELNAIALANLSAWVLEIFPKAKRTAEGGYRVKSADLGRDLEEDLSITTKGISRLRRP